MAGCQHKVCLVVNPPGASASGKKEKIMMIEHVGIILTGSVMIIIIAYLALDQLLTFIWKDRDDDDKT